MYVSTLLQCCLLSCRAYNTGESEKWTQVKRIGPMIHQGVNFDAGLSRGNALGFKWVNISSKVWGMPDLQRKQIKIYFLTIKCINRHDYAAMIPSEAG